LKGVPICHCQWIGADEPGCQIFPIVEVVAEKVVVEIAWYIVVIGDEGVVLAGQAVVNRLIANNASIKNNVVIFLDNT
jgi:hypothetical protein